MENREETPEQLCPKQGGIQKLSWRNDGVWAKPPAGSRDTALAGGSPPERCTLLRA